MSVLTIQSPTFRSDWRVRRFVSVKELRNMRGEVQYGRNGAGPQDSVHSQEKQRRLCIFVFMEIISKGEVILDKACFQIACLDFQ